MEQGIYKAIPAIMGEIGYIGKEKKNQQQGFMYRGVDDVMNALQPLLVKHGVFVVPEVLEQSREDRQTKSGGNLIYSIFKVKYTFFANDGSSITSIVVGEGMDSADKSANKAMSVAYKYACFQVFCIPTEEMKDPDAETPDPAPKSTPKNTPKQDPPKTEYINQNQALILSGLAKKKWGEEHAKDELLKYCGHTAVKLIPLAEYDALVKQLEA